MAPKRKFERLSIAGQLRGGDQRGSEMLGVKMSAGYAVSRRVFACCVLNLRRFEHHELTLARTSR